MDISAISSEKHHEQLSRTAYSIGFILGDGYLQHYSAVKKGKRYPFQCIHVGKPDLDVVERVRDEIEATFGVKYAVFKQTLASGLPFYNLRAYRRDVFDFFAINTRYKAEIPKFFFSAPKDIKRDLIAGLMDSDGHISQSTQKNWWQIGFGMTNREIVSGAANIMRSLGVKVGQIGECQQGDYRLFYRIRPNIRSFIEAGCYFHAERKTERLKAWESHVLGSETTSAAPVTPGEGIVRHASKDA